MNVKSAVIALSMVASLMSVAEVHAEDDTIRVGLILETSGPFAVYGRQMQNGIRAYMEQHGDVVAGKKIELIIRDSTGPAPAVAQRHAQELVTQHDVDFLAGFGFTPNAMAVASIATQSKTPMIIMNAATSSVSTRSPYIVRTSFTLPQVSMPMGDWAAKNGIKRVYTLVADYGPGIDAETYFQKGFLDAGGEVVGETRVPIDTNDFSSYLRRIADAKPDAVFVFVPAGEPMIQFIKGFGNSGLQKSGIKVLSTEGWADDGELQSLGEDSLGAVSTSYYSVTHDSEKNREFVKTYFDIEKSGLYPNNMTVAAYDGMDAIYTVAAQLNGEIDGEKAMEILRGLSIDSPRGPLTIDPDTRDPIQTVYVRRVEMRDGELANVEFDAYLDVMDPGNE